MTMQPEPLISDDTMLARYRTAFGKAPDVHLWALLSWVRDDYEAERVKVTATQPWTDERIADNVRAVSHLDLPDAKTRSVTTFQAEQLMLMVRRDMQAALSQRDARIVELEQQLAEAMGELLSWAYQTKHEWGNPLSEEMWANNPLRQRYKELTGSDWAEPFDGDGDVDGDGDIEELQKRGYTITPLVALDAATIEAIRTLVDSGTVKLGVWEKAAGRVRAWVAQVTGVQQLVAIAANRL